MRKIQIGLIGAYSDLKIEEYKSLAQEIGREIAKANAIFIGGVEKGGGLVTEAAKSARINGGTVISICRTKEDATDCDVIIPTYGAVGLREYLLPLACDVIIAINGGSGTLNEMTVAYQNNIPVIILENSGGWSEKLQNSFLDDRKRYKFVSAKTAKEAVQIAVRIVEEKLYKPRKQEESI